MCKMLWDAVGISQPGIVACVGAGGKSSLLQSLAATAGKRGCPVVVTATTKMFYQQVSEYLLVINENYGAGVAKIADILAAERTVAWFAGQDGEKVIGVPPDWVDKLAIGLPEAYILVEADGARRCLIKAPNKHEPVIPAYTSMTVGIVNISVLGQPLSTATTHRLDLVTSIINKQPGELITWQDLARLAVQQEGIFQYALGTKVLLLSGGGDTGANKAAKQIAGYVKLARVGIDRVIVTTGYGSNMLPSQVYRL